MENTYHIIIIFLLIVVIWLLIDRKEDQIENFEASDINTEALQNVASIYNNQNLTTTNLNVTSQGTVANLNVTGKSTIKDESVQNLTVSGSFNMLPPGSIMMFNGTKAPAGWALCDGQSGRPDLRGRFVLGYGAGHGLTNRSLAAKGGAENHTLTVAQMPKHRHTYRDAYVGEKNGRSSGGYWRPGTRYTSYAGSSKPHNNMPPFYVLAYIIKL
jgi:Phage Tail Collar Domain